ncbi:uncharacterized protein LOC113340941 [Papaver somniferum]|uniref:uncharacterized protein LOC113340941 n=1 Tax=Papaver somniferum TaxID=3469 RepID=UPI000E6F91E8|nr:uncharacterized protein LOC113340941 [Papaver somniferum]
MVNFTKSSVHYSERVPCRFRRILTRRLKVHMMLPIEKYLGIPLIIGKKKKESFSHLYDRVKNRLSSWDGKTVSQCGKSLMVRTITNTIPAYSMSCFQIPTKIIKKFEAAQRDFWWGFEEKRGTYVTSWKSLKIHKDCGGQGFRDLKILNQSLLVRAAWKIFTNTDTQWGKSIQKQIGFIKQNRQWRLGKCDKELILQDSQNWNTELIQHLFEEHTVELIMRMRIPSFAKDKLIWKLTNNGAFTLK